MAIKYLKETTEWSESTIPNHIYIFENNACVGYIKSGETTENYFNAPLKQFSKTRRQFKDVTKEYK
jgi:hypothetical protein